MDQRLGADRDLVAEHGGDLVRVAGAADVAEQRHPVGGLAHLLLEARGLADPRREQARPQLRLERLTERVVLRERQRRDELAEAKRCVQDGESSRCIGRRGRARSSHDARSRAGEPTSSAQGGHHGGITRPRRRSHQGGSHRRPDRPALVRSGSPTPTWRGWSSATSTPRAACSDGGSSCTSRTARPTTPSRPPRRAKLVEQRPRRRRLRRHLQLHAAGHQGPGRGRGQDALHLPGAVRGAGVRSAHLLHRPGAGAAGRPVHPVADAGDRGEDLLPAVRRLHLAARDERGASGRSSRPTAGRSSARSTSRSTTRTTARRSSGSPRAAPTWSSTPSCRPASRRSSSSCTTPASPPRRPARLHVLRRELPEHGAGRARRGPVQLPRLLPGRRRSVQPEAARAVRRALSRRCEVHRRRRLLGPLPRAAAVGGCRDGGGLARAGRRDRGPGSRVRSPRAPAGRRPWCRASTTCA